VARAAVTRGRFARASPHEAEAATPKMVFLIQSVVSTWATWMMYSWGSLITIQMKAAAPSTNRLLIRRGFQRRRTPS